MKTKRFSEEQIIGVLKEAEGIRQPSARPMGLSQRRAFVVYPTWQTERECVHRKLQRQIPRRVPQRTLVLSMAHARRIIEAWRIEYNDVSCYPTSLCA